MKKIVFILTACFISLAFVVPMQAATIWFPTESGQVDVNFIIDGTFPLALFDDDDTGYESPLLLNKPGDTIAFKQLNGDWEVESTETSNSITLTNSFNFVVALDLGGEDGWVGNTGYEKKAFGVYNVLWSEQVEAQMALIDAQPVPLPASVLLLGAGLLGIIGIRRRK
jgi:hypothetical protein